MSTEQFETGEVVGIRAVRTDMQGTVIRQDGDRVLVRVHGSDQEVNVPAACLYR